MQKQNIFSLKKEVKQKTLQAMNIKYTLISLGNVSSYQLNDT